MNIARSKKGTIKVNVLIYFSAFVCYYINYRKKLQLELHTEKKEKNEKEEKLKLIERKLEVQLSKANQENQDTKQLEVGVTNYLNMLRSH